MSSNAGNGMMGNSKESNSADGKDGAAATTATPNASVTGQPALSTVPSLLHALQNEFDNRAYECNQLKSTVIRLQAELAHSLYQYDAACQVIARLIAERDEARQFIAQLSIDNPEILDQLSATTDTNNTGNLLQNNNTTTNTK